MSTEIKNTLFRFATMRAPEVLQKDQVEKSFVTYQILRDLDGLPLTNVFLAKAQNVPTGKTKAKALEETAITFAQNAIETKEELHQGGYITKDFYDFAVWLTANRSTLTISEVNNKITNNDLLTRLIPLEPIANQETLNTLWENLFFQIITYKSNYVRDAILSILVTDFFLKNYSVGTEIEVESLRKLAQARVIIPKKLFEKEDTSTKKTLLKEALAALPINTKELDREMELLLCKDKIESYKSIITDLKKVQINYNRAEQKRLEAAQKAHEQAVADLRSNAATVEKTIKDPISGFERTVKEYTDLVIPSFEYTREPELETNTFTSKVPNETETLINNLIESNGYETFDEIINHYENQIAISSQAIFENTTLTETVLTTNGVVLPSETTTSGNIFNVGGTYSTGTTPLTLLFSGASNGANVISASYRITFDDDTTVNGTSFNDTLINNKLSVKIFNEGINLFNRTSMEINGVFTLSDGKKINFSGSITVSETPFLIGSIKIIDDGNLTFLVRGKGIYEIKALVIDPDLDLPDDVDNPSDNGGVINYIPSGFGIKRLGIADYRRVEQEICCYVPGEVSHIENVMAKEYKERSTRRLRRSENTTTTTKEKESEHLTDSSSTDRFEMNQEVSSVLSEDKHIGANASISGEYSGIKFSAGADYANNTSSEESNLQAVTHAKEVTEKVVDRVVQKVKEERISKIIEEFEENNKHGYDNREGEKHISGVYRWVDKIYKNKVLNYGKRLMYEFMIPQPAFFHNKAISMKKDEFGFEKITKPVDPRIGDAFVALKSHKDLNSSNYQHWAAIYNCEITPIPELDKVTGWQYTFADENSNSMSNSKDISFDLPEGYFTKSFSCIAEGKAYDGAASWSITVGNEKLYNSYTTLKPISKFTGKLPIGVYFDRYWAGTVNVSIYMQRTPEFYEQWQIETFNTIVKAYELELEKYNAKMDQLKSMQQEKVRTNPMFYRQIENTVLRKNCIEYIASHDVLGKNSLIKDGNIKEIHAKYDELELETYSAKVKFFEQAFEWSLMSYYFYPFYWAEKDNWGDLYNVSESDDATFRAFLQSGMARVIVTIRPGFEEAVNWYMATGQVWNGGQVPTVDDPMFVSIVEELREPEGEVEQTWESRVPTSLTIIQAGEIGLEVDKALPCCEDRGDNPFGIKKNNPKLLEFSFYENTGNVMQTIGELDSAGLFPRIYQCMGQTFTINRNASWFPGTHVSVIYEKLAEQLSLISGVQAYPALTTDGRIFGIKFKIDANQIKDFSFMKPGSDLEGLDSLIISVQNDSLVIKRLYDQLYSDTILDKNKVAITQSEVNVLLPISRFLV